MIPSSADDEGQQTPMQWLTQSVSLSLQRWGDGMDIFVDTQVPQFCGALSISHYTGISKRSACRYTLTIIQSTETLSLLHRVSGIMFRTARLITWNKLNLGYKAVFPVTTLVDHGARVLDHDASCRQESWS
jgi:hypothetical protein